MRGRQSPRAGRCNIRPGLTALFAGLICILAACSSAPPLKITGTAEGAAYRITVTDPPGGLDAEQLKRDVAQIVAQVDSELAPAPGSQASRFASAPADTQVAVDKPFAALVARAQSFGAQTDGAFDITDGAIRSIWQQSDNGPVHRLPNTDEVDAALDNVGRGLLQVQTDPPTLEKQVAGASLSVDRLRKGVVVDRIARRLDALGAGHYLVDLDGRLFARGTKKGHRHWQVGLEKPGDGHRHIGRVVGLVDAGMATAGSYAEPVMLGEHEIAGAIDPRTGRPVAHDLRAVTVIGRSATGAEMMAWALLVLGPDNGMAFANAHNVAALFMVRTARGYAQQTSKAFAHYQEAPARQR